MEEQNLRKLSGCLGRYNLYIRTQRNNPLAAFLNSVVSYVLGLSRMEFALCVFDHLGFYVMFNTAVERPK